MDWKLKSAVAYVNHKVNAGVPIGVAVNEASCEYGVHAKDIARLIRRKVKDGK